MKQLIRILVAALLLMPVGAGAKSKKPILMVEGVTIEQQLVTAIAARALKKAGFKHQLVGVPDAEALAALLGGDAHVHLSMPVSDDLRTAVEGAQLRSLGGLADNDPAVGVLKIVGKGVKKKWPYAQKLLKRMILSPETLSVPVAEVQAGTPVTEAAATWFKANPKIWKPWIAASKNWMKP